MIQNFNDFHDIDKIMINQLRKIFLLKVQQNNNSQIQQEATKYLSWQNLFSNLIYPELIIDSLFLLNLYINMGNYCAPQQQVIEEELVTQIQRQQMSKNTFPKTTQQRKDSTSGSLQELKQSKHLEGPYIEIEIINEKILTENDDPIQIFAEIRRQPSSQEAKKTNNINKKFLRMLE
ncbi:hypothetical protein pb186bvf_009584 [Paramecium bursaria]